MVIIEYSPAPNLQQVFTAVKFLRIAVLTSQQLRGIGSLQQSTQRSKGYSVTRLAVVLDLILLEVLLGQSPCDPVFVPVAGV